MRLKKFRNNSDESFKQTRESIRIILGSLHVNYVFCKGFKRTGLIIRLTRLSKDFHSGISIKKHFCALVHPILEYGAIIWDPQNASDSIQLYRVQRQFLRIAINLL